VGRPRDRQIGVAVLEATLPTLDESGYGRLTLEEVACRAGPTKPASTVAGPSRQRLVLAAPGQRLGEARAPDIGCTLCDRDLRAAFMTTLLDPPRAAVKNMLDRAHPTVTCARTSIPT
jgi:hypothetical protein